MTCSTCTHSEEIEIPRVRKFGCGSQKPLQDASNIGDSANLFAATKSPGSFIKSLISPALPAAHANDVALPNAALPGVTVCSSPRPSTRSSLEGQPPTILAEHVTHANGGVESHLAPDAELDLDTALEGIYASTPHDAASFVLEEKLDEGQIMLMDVPELPPPTHHARESVFFPDGTRDFVTTSNKGGDGVGRSACANAVAFLKPVKGIKPLALDLSWRSVSLSFFLLC
ncbi:hypothetical protein F5I97DRAFT_807682 [Phlebopus sp. FC_14]|nr:hypothetical protein F5I97DRAFT_807682 [Phlebopus sp. FC_14]